MSIWSFLIRRLLQGVFSVFLISAFTFYLITISPGATSAFFNVPIISVPDSLLIQSFRHPNLLYYFSWMNMVFIDGNLGTSLKDGQPVLTIIVSRLPATLLLTGTALIISIIVAIPMGIVSAVKRNSFFDFVFTGFSFVGLSIPPFFASLLAIIYFALILDWFPVSNMREFTDHFDLYDRISHLILPASVLAFGMIASKAKIIRSSLLEILGQDYITTANAKGLKQYKVILKHAFKNALIPLITILSLQMPILIGGAFMVEQVFAWPGLGRVSINAALDRDFPVILGTTVFLAIAVIGINLLTDFFYMIVDPRVKYGKN